MYGEARKLQVIEQIIQIENDSILDEDEAIINNIPITIRKNGFKYSSGIWTEKEAEEIKLTNEESSAKVNSNDW